LIQVKFCDIGKEQEELHDAEDSIGVGPVEIEVLT